MVNHSNEIANVTNETNRRIDECTKLNESLNSKDKKIEEVEIELAEKEKVLAVAAERIETASKEKVEHGRDLVEREGRFLDPFCPTSGWCSSSRDFPLRQEIGKITGEQPTGLGREVLVFVMGRKSGVLAC